MRIGISFNLRPDGPLPVGAPDDIHEEFDSPVTVRAIGDVLRALGHTVTELGDGRALVEALLKEPPDLLFNFAEGTGISRSRESRVPAVCEMLGIPYTGSDPLALAVALDKDMTRRLVESVGVVVPRGFTMPVPPMEYDGDFDEFPAILTETEIPLPVIAKPVCEGSSKGIRSKCLIETEQAFGPIVHELWKAYQQPVLVEEFINGDEITVGVVGNDPPQVIGIMRVTPKQQTSHFVYSLEVKRDWRSQVDYECPAHLEAETMRAIEDAALVVYTTLGCRDIARLDFRVKDGVPYFIEINPLPGMNPESSDLVILSEKAGLPYAELIKKVFEAACSRQGISYLPG